MTLEIRCLTSNKLPLRQPTSCTEARRAILRNKVTTDHLFWRTPRRCFWMRARDVIYLDELSLISFEVWKLFRRHKVKSNLCYEYRHKLCLAVKNSSSGWKKNPRKVKSGVVFLLISSSLINISEVTIFGFFFGGGWGVGGRVGVGVLLWQNLTWISHEKCSFELYYTHMSVENTLGIFQHLLQVFQSGCWQGRSTYCLLITS